MGFVKGEPTEDGGHRKQDDMYNKWYKGGCTHREDQAGGQGESNWLRRCMDMEVEYRKFKVRLKQANLETCCEAGSGVDGNGGGGCVG